MGDDNGKICVIYADPIFSPRIIVAHLYFLFRMPIEYCRILIKNKSFGGKRVFCEAAYYAKTIRELQINHVHAHFAWNAADCAMIIKRLTGIPFSLTAHQSDIHRFPKRLYEKLSGAKFILTCTRGNMEYLSKKYGEVIGAKTFAVYHGVDVNKFFNDDREGKKEIDILSIGTLIKVKGFEYLIRACGVLRENNFFKKCVIVGKGEEKDNLEYLIEQMGLKDKIEIRDPVPYEEVANIYRKAKIFVLPAIVIDGAPHGIPNVIAEAMAMGLPVISSDVPNISELIENDKDGILVREKDPNAIAEAIEGFMVDRNKCIAIGKMARKKIENDFDAKKHIQKIAEIFMENNS